MLKTVVNFIFLVALIMTAVQAEKRSYQFDDQVIKQKIHPRSSKKIKQNLLRKKRILAKNKHLLAKGRREKSIIEIPHFDVNKPIAKSSKLLSKHKTARSSGLTKLPKKAFSILRKKDPYSNFLRKKAAILNSTDHQKSRLSTNTPHISSSPRHRKYEIKNITSKMIDKQSISMNQNLHKAVSTPITEIKKDIHNSFTVDPKDSSLFKVSLTNPYLENYLDQDQLNHLKQLKLKILPTPGHNNNCLLYSISANNQGLLTKILNNSEQAKTLLSVDENQRDLSSLRVKIFESIFENLDKIFTSPYGNLESLRTIIQDFKIWRSYEYRYDFMEKVIDVINLNGQSHVVNNCSQEQGIQNLKAIFNQDDFINKVNTGKNFTDQKTAQALKQNNFLEKIYWLLKVHQLEGQKTVHDLKNLVIDIGKSGIFQIHGMQMQNIIPYIQVMTTDHLNRISDNKTRDLFIRSLALREVVAIILKEDQEFLRESSINGSTLDKDYADIISFLYNTPIYVWGPAYDKPKSLSILNGSFIKLPYSDLPIHIYHNELNGNHFSKIIELKN